VKSKALDKKTLDKFKQLLIETRSKIAGNLQHLEKDTLNTSQREAAGDLSGYSLHMADQATDNFDREFTLGLASVEQRVLNLVEAALRKVGDKTYGSCEACKKPIPQKRLVAMPYTPLCIKCQEIEEKEQRQL